MSARADRCSSPTPPHRLPEGWTAPEVFEDILALETLQVRRAGVAATSPSGVEMTGSAAVVLPSSHDPVDRAWFELFERVAIVEAMDAGGSHRVRARTGEVVSILPVAEVFPESGSVEWCFAKSSGVAIHASWRQACDAALSELIERDRVLRSWYGETTPRSLGHLREDLPTTHVWSAWSFPAPEPSDIEVVGVVGLPSDPTHPTAMGFAARSSVRAALAHAQAEALQVLSFLWGEAIADPPESTPPSAFGHLEHFQVPRRRVILEDWLTGQHSRYAPEIQTQSVGRVTFVDLTPSWMERGLRVAKAISPDVHPLAFGRSPFTAHLPERCRIHPIS